MTQEVRFSINQGFHKKGDPYPQINFSEIERHKLTSKTNAIACSNQQVTEQIERQFVSNPNSIYATYYYFSVMDQYRNE